MKQSNNTPNKIKPVWFVAIIVAIILIAVSAFNYFSLRATNKNLTEKIMRVEQGTVINTENIKKIVEYINVANQKAQELQAQLNAPAVPAEEEIVSDEEPVVDEE